MIIYALDGLNGIKGVVDTFKSCIWTKQFFAQDDFQLVVAGTPYNMATLTRGTYLVREKDVTGQNSFKNVMIIENVESHYAPDEGEVLTITGRGLKSILARRIIWEQISAEGVNLGTVLEQVMEDNVVSPSVAERAIPDFIFGLTIQIPETVDIQLFGENIAEWLQSVGEKYGYGWDVAISGGKYLFRINKGTDLSDSVVLSPASDGILSCDYSKTTEGFANVALVGGEGEGTSKHTASVGSASGLNRYETYVDGSAVSSNGDIITLATYLNMLKEYGAEQLAGNGFTEAFDAEINPYGVYKIGLNYGLGDIVTIQTDTGISATSRLIEMIESEDETGTAVVGTFSEWEVE